ncbi:MAG TPA: HlyD family efflux transporter periplasmic adaptor subunit [Sedimenticola thiotaurini]|uniref:HlyD family efflux transporter periplasmic adaptor subunit n=1 Tax=Sedimenticola thiotaurini TaxID=1543721 RepID=A0A831RQP8_9GAMM|nr:HlyD family efflux transporter periplasmic adaptor subunit [Sedimenticola thiotaurini]
MNRKNTLLVLVAILGMAAGALFLWQQWRLDSGLPEGLIQANGRLEGDRYTVASRFAGRVSELLAREGDTVEQGQVLVKLQDDQARARLDQARARAAAAAARLGAARQDLDILERQVPLKIGTAEADVAHAEAAVAAAKARAHQARKDASRYEKLAGSGSVDRYRADQANLAWAVSRAELATAMAALTQARKRLAEARLGKESILTKRKQLQAAQAEADQARAAEAEARSALDDLVIRAPVAGTVTTRMVDTGEVVAAGAPLLTIVDLDRLYLKVFVPERQIGRLRLGLPARVFSDAFPGQPFPARVRYIASRAQFTPKEVQTPDERVKLVYAVKLYLDENPGHRLTPGLPADAVIRWRENVPWSAPRW